MSGVGLFCHVWVMFLQNSSLDRSCKPVFGTVSTSLPTSVNRHWALFTQTPHHILEGPLRATLKIHEPLCSCCDLSVAAMLPGPLSGSCFSFCLRGGQNKAIEAGCSERALFFQGAMRAWAGPTSVCVQSQAGPEHSVPLRPLPWGSLFLISCYHSGSMFSCTELSGA